MDIMEEAIIKHLTGVLQSQIGDCLPVTSLGSHLSDLGKKKKNYLKRVGFEKFLIKHPNAFAIIDGNVLPVQNLGAASNAAISNRSFSRNQPPPSSTSTFKQPSKAAVQAIKNDILNSKSCMVCSDDFEFYAFGVCFHPICHKCSTKLRVLCDDKQCPTCRIELNEVLFTQQLQPIDELNTKSYIKEQKYGILLENQQIRTMYRKLLEHKCRIKGCGKNFEDFDDLKSHLQLKHGEYFCKLCLRQCKKFTHERITYSTIELEKHKSEGDDGEGSAHKGHPLCKFCDCRYLDNDELLRHLQQHHCSCHLCDDTNYVFYADINDLWDHHYHLHFACREDCCHGIFKAVFKAEEELKTHVQKEHSRGKGAKVALTYGTASGASSQLGTPSRTLEILRSNVSPIRRGEEGLSFYGSVLYTTSYFGFIRRNDAPFDESEHVFFNTESCDLNQDDDLSRHFSQGERVYGRALQTINHRSKWRAVSVTKLSEMQHSGFPALGTHALADRVRHNSACSDFTTSGMSDITSISEEAFPALPASISEEAFPALRTQYEVVQKHTDNEESSTNWNIVVGKKMPSNGISTPLKNKKVVEKSSEDKAQGVGCVHHNLQKMFGFITKQSNTFEENIYFDNKAYQLGMGLSTNVDLTQELKVGEKLCYILEPSGSVKRNTKSKYRAVKVWKFSREDNLGKSTTNGYTVNANDSLLKKVSTSTAGKTNGQKPLTQGLGTLHSVQAKFGFITMDGFSKSEDNVYFHITAYQDAMGKHEVKDLSTELRVRERMGFLLEDPSLVKKDATSKYRAALVWKQNENLCDMSFSSSSADMSSPTKVNTNIFTSTVKAKQLPGDEVSFFESSQSEMDSSELHSLNSEEELAVPVILNASSSSPLDMTNTILDIFRVVFGTCWGVNLKDSLFELDEALAINDVPNLSYIAFVQFFINKPPKVFTVQQHVTLAGDDATTTPRQCFELSTAGLNKIVSTALKAHGKANSISENVLTINNTNMYIILNRDEKDEMREISLHTGF
ncbi:uncharacterized protein LOC143469989 isoform X2 [Clavelina lepadiformis]|uniref:uncharacterized protein LOC143469989 isoform X2 n=1 Tax=Clavelina lepadiformis TaxID=159417 RepID=UPI0040426324